MRKLIWIPIVLVAFIVSILAVSEFFYTIQNVGHVSTAYGLTSVPSTIDWGKVTLVKSITRTGNLTNTGTRDIAALTATYGNETANVINYTLTWDAEDLSLPIAQSLLANFTLTVTNATEGNFTFDIYIADKG